MENVSYYRPFSIPWDTDQEKIKEARKILEEATGKKIVFVNQRFSWQLFEVGEKE